MSLRGLKIILQAAVCAVLLAGSANALTITPISPTESPDAVDAISHTLGSGSSYGYNSGSLGAGQIGLPGALGLFFNFNVLESAVVTITSGDQPGVISNIENLTLSWLASDGISVLGSLAVPSGFGVDPTILSLALAGPGIYYLQVTGNVLQSGSSFEVAVATTPIPPALLLFGSALAGLGFLGRRSRRRTAASPLA